MHRRFCKFSLGLPSSTSNLAVYGDLGRVPLMIRCKVTLIKYWLRISTHWDISGLLKEAYQLTLTDSPDKWTTSVKQVLDEAGFSYVWNNPLGVRHNEFISQLLQSLLDQYSQDWGSELLCSRKLRTYRIFKNTLSYEAYLNLPPYLRVPLAKLRASAHRLRIETGRYTLPTPTPLEERTCASCGVLEDEVHFLINCQSYNGKARMDLFQRCAILNPSFFFMDSTNRFTSIMSSRDPTLICLLAKFVSQSFCTMQSRPVA